MADIISLLVNLLIQSIILAPFLWFAGKKLAEKAEDVKFFDAVWIIVLGNLISYLLVYLLADIFAYMGIFAVIINLVLWLGLIKHFFKMGWVKALAVAIIAVIVYAIVAFLLGLLGFTFLYAAMAL